MNEVSFYPLVSGGSDNGAKNLSKAVGETPPSDPDYIRLMKALKMAKSFLEETKLKLTDLNNQEAQEQFIKDLYERCPNLGNKFFKDIVDVMIDILHKYYMGFNQMIVRKSYSGHDESIMITCIKYLFNIYTKEQLVSASKLYSREQLAHTQCRVRIFHFYSKGLLKKIMPAEELLTILNIELESTTVKF